MSSKNTIPALAGALIIATLAVWFHSARSIRAAEASIAAIAQKRARFEAEVRRMEPRVKTSEQNRSDLQAELDRLQAEKAAASAVVRPANSARAPTPANPRELLQSDPKLQVLWLKSARGRLTRAYGPFYAALHLSPEQVEKFQANVIKRQEQLMDLEGIVQSQGAESREAVAAFRKKANEEYQAAQVNLLGPDGYQRLQEYERSLPMRAIVEGLAGTAALEADPLSAQQGEQLTLILAGASNRYLAGSRADAATIDWDAADTQARQILSVPQFRLFQTAAPLNTGTTRWLLQLEAAIARAKQAEEAAASGNPPIPSGG